MNDPHPPKKDQGAVPAEPNQVGKWAFFGAVLVTLATGCLVWQSRRDDSLERVKRDGALRIGYAVEAPFAFVDESGHVTGESPEIAKRIAARIGVRDTQWRQVEFDALMRELKAERIDVIAAGMFITPEREKEASFSKPTCRVKEALLVRSGNPAHLHSYRDAIAAGKRIAVLAGSVEEAMLLQMNVSPPRLLRVPDAQAGRAAVESGVADAFSLSAPTLRWMLRTNASAHWEIADPFEQPSTDRTQNPGLAAFVFRRGDRRLREAWDTELERFIGSTEHRELVAAFGFTAAELPPDPTSASFRHSP